MLLSEPLTPTATAAPAGPVHGGAPADADRPLVGYVVKSYPRFSETFIVRELVAREEAGERAVVASLRPPKDPRFHALLARVQAPVTYVPDDVRGGLVRVWEGLAALRAAGVAPSREALDALLDEDPGVAAQAVGVARWAVAEGVTHLHAHFASLPGRTTRLAAMLTGLPWTMTAHAKDVFHEDVDPRRLAAVMADADGVVAVSDMTTAWLAERHPTARLHRVHNGLDLDELTWSSPAHRPAVVAAVGRLVPKKGFDVLLDAVALLRGRGVDVRLRLAGAGDGAADLAARVTRLGLEDAVELLGPLPQHEVVALLRGAAAFAAPCVVAEDGDRDGLPTVVLESLAVGTPVVSTPVTGVPEAVIDGVTGHLVPERDAAALADALQRLLADGEERERLSRAGRAHVELRFDVRGQAAALRRITADVAAARTTAPAVTA
ncbi:glycosyltransferase family 4 protein [Pseudokineococcus lusitanus]|uniref:Glycosyltransferase involved in cell wall biosynthesis n=1 Tax=Pseudokineococcus lusitanus TaxID=763993 RepID=A0A3N1G8M4_9ACTN|nr:glycosyltransferase [Pseudokineococcus lusitanus]ROP26590.1 glycosyltransferase involved in cell wall biosynthesis [Pseudokineococcus lusitanus]